MWSSIHRLGWVWQGLTASLCVCLLQESEDAVKALAKEKDMLEREKWDLRRQTKEATEQANVLRSQMDMKENRVKELEAELTMVSHDMDAVRTLFVRPQRAQWCHLSVVIWCHKCKQGAGLQSCRCIHISSNARGKPLCDTSSSLRALKALSLPPGWGRNSCLFFVCVLLCRSLRGAVVTLCVINLSPPWATHNHPQILTSSGITDQICWYISARAASLSSNWATKYISTFFFHPSLLYLKISLCSDCSLYR